MEIVLITIRRFLTRRVHRDQVNHIAISISIYLLLTVKRYLYTNQFIHSQLDEPNSFLNIITQDGRDLSELSTDDIFFPKIEECKVKLRIK
jgi:hypothetical protein